MDGISNGKLGIRTSIIVDLMITYARKLAGGIMMMHRAKIMTSDHKTNTQRWMMTHTWLQNPAGCDPNAETRQPTRERFVMTIDYGSDRRGIWFSTVCFLSCLNSTSTDCKIGSGLLITGNNLLIVTDNWMIQGQFFSRRGDEWFQRAKRFVFVNCTTRISNRLALHVLDVRTRTNGWFNATKNVRHAELSRAHARSRERDEMTRHQRAKRTRKHLWFFQVTRQTSPW